MLVLSRKRKEKIVITYAGVTIVINVVEIRGDKVRVGIEAPREVSINRFEVQAAIDNSRAPLIEAGDGHALPNARAM